MGVAALAFVTTQGFTVLELAALLLRCVQTVRPWGMIEVFMLGVLVALVKL